MVLDARLEHVVAIGLFGNQADLAYSLGSADSNCSYLL